MKNKIKYSVVKKDFEVTWFSGSGAGGQHRNKHNNCCRLKHKETGIITTGQSSKERKLNRREALQGMAKHPKFKAYCDMRLRDIEEDRNYMEEMMSPENLKVEVRNDKGEWTEI